MFSNTAITTPNRPAAQTASTVTSRTAGRLGVVIAVVLDMARGSFR